MKGSLACLTEADAGLSVRMRCASARSLTGRQATHTSPAVMLNRRVLKSVGASAGDSEVLGMEDEGGVAALAEPRAGLAHKALHGQRAAQEHPHAHPSHLSLHQAPLFSMGKPLQAASTSSH